jgi:ATP-binding cassette subfamily B protein
MMLQKAGQRIIIKLRTDVFTHIMNMSLNQFTEMPVGSLVTRVANYTQSMSDLFTNLLVNVLKNVTYILGVYIYMFMLNRTLSLFSLIPVAIIAVTSFLFSKVVGNIFRKERKTISDMNTYLNENLSGMKITQIFNQEEFKDEEFKVKKYREENERRQFNYIGFIYELMKTLAEKGKLKERTPIWLNSEQLRPLVLGFTHPIERLGGSGALYVILRKKK